MIDKLIFHWNRPWLNVLVTLFVNFKCLPFKVAIKFPIHIYGKAIVYWMCGDIELKCNEIYSGMITFGRNTEFFNGHNRNAFWYLSPKSKIIFYGPCAVSSNYSLRVSSNAILEFGAYSFFGSGVKFICTDHIIIGDYTRCAYESQIVDTNSHYVFDMSTNSVVPRKGEILIGSKNWIGNRTTINKGCRTKDGTIVCAGSLLNKDYTKLDGDYQMLGGAPAKLIKTGLRRIFSTKIEVQISRFFSSNENKIYQLDGELEDDMLDIENWFKVIK